MPSKALLLAGLPFIPLAASQWFTADEVQNRFILYNGTISGTFKHSPDAPSACKDYELGSYKNALLAVGLYDKWDSNPFFFEFDHVSSEDEGGFISFTDDAIYNLHLTSAAKVCMKDGKLCEFLEFDPIFKPTEILDLNKATIKKTTLDGGDGYSVSGDQKTWVSDMLIKNEVDVARPEGASYESGCMFQENFIWNASTPFKYDVTFTNTTSKATLSITAPHGSLSLDFAGDRDDNPRSDLYISPGKAVELDTSDSSEPKFQYVDGSDITFGDDGDESGGVSSTSASSSPTATTTSSTGQDSSQPSVTGTDSAPTTTQTGAAGPLSAKMSMAYLAGGVTGALTLFI